MRFARMLRTAGLGILLCYAAASWGEESLTVVPGRIPYLGEAQGHVVVTTSPDRPGEALTLEVTTVSGTVLGKGPVLPGQRSAVDIPLGELPKGVTALHCRLLAGGAEAATADTRLTKLPPKPHAVQIDNRRRGLVVDGLPFFPFGFWAAPAGRPEGDPSIPPDIAAQGFNLYAPMSSGAGMAWVEHIRTWMDRCAEVGVKVNFDIRYDCFAGSKEAGLTPQARQAIRTLIETFRDHPALLSWYIFDEPYEREYERVADMYRLVKELDPYHPVIIQGPGIFPPYVPRGQRPYVDWRQITDVTWLDAYPVNILSRDQRSNPYWLSEVAPNARRGVASVTAYWLTRTDRFFGYSSPLWHSPQLYGAAWNSTRREPSAQEVRAMTYAGLISGATAIEYFIYTPGMEPTSPRLLAEAAKLAQEVIELTPFLLSEEPRRRATASMPGVLTAGWKDRGMALVAAVNADNAPTSFKVTLADSSYSGPAEVLFENRQVEVRAGVIEDTIEAQGTRVYQIPEGPFPPDRAALSPDNIRFNPSFEEWVNAASPPDVRIKRGGGSTCFLDARTAVHSRHSLRMTASGSGIELNLNPVGQLGVFKGEKIQRDSRYRVSLWAKADQPGLSLSISLWLSSSMGLSPHIDLADGKQFTLSPDWKEYSLVVTTQEAQGEAAIWPMLKFNGPGTAWVDLLQVVPVQ